MPAESWLLLAQVTARCAQPIFSDRICVSLWDRDLLFEDTPVAHVYFDYKQVVRTEKVESAGYFSGAKYTASKPRWVNLYGAPLGKQSTSKANFARIANTMPDEASTYRGRLLISSEVRFCLSCRRLAGDVLAGHTDY